MSRFIWKWLLAAVTLLPALGCTVESSHPRVTEIEFGELRNLGYACGGALSSWTVTERASRDTGTAGCEQPVLFTDRAAGVESTFDITGYSGAKLCWQGSCDVRAIGGTITFPDCSAQIQGLCGL